MDAGRRNCLPLVKVEAIEFGLEGCDACLKYRRSIICI